MFTKLGVRYLVVVDERGLYRGVIEKNRYVPWTSLPKHLLTRFLAGTSST